MVRTAAWLALPIVLLAAIVAYLLIARPLAELTEAAPPVEELSVEATHLTPGMISLTVRADGSAPLTIAQIQVDGGYRTFTATPSPTIGRLGTARVDIAYPWVETETHHILFVTSTGATFEHTIDVAVADADFGPATLGRLAFVGVLLGIVPIALGLLAYPALRRLGENGITFILALTVGLLIFLLIDTLNEGLELGAEALDRLRGTSVVFIAMTVTALALLALGRRGGKAPDGLRLAFFVALGIGLHNFGEGLAVGAALATGAAALATFLVVGFVIHNVTEGVGIAAPVAAGPPPSIPAFVGLAALAGLPAIAGILLGTSAVNPFVAALCFGVGAGAILQVVIEVSAFTMRREGMTALARPAGATGIIAGLVIMYATALLV